MLLDANVLIALAWPHHVHHDASHAWFKTARRAPWATCPLTQLAFVRVSSNPAIVAGARSPGEASAALARITALEHHEFWPDDVSVADCARMRSAALVGHRQVKDAYLLALADLRGGRVATFDRGLREMAGPGSVRLVELIG